MSSDHLLEGLIFQAGGGDEYRAPKPWFVSWTQGLEHCGRGFDLDGVPKAKGNEEYQEILDDLPAKKKG